MAVQRSVAGMVQAVWHVCGGKSVVEDGISPAICSMQQL